MVLISLPNNAPFPAQNGFYAYDKSAGKDSTVYIIDTGANLANTVSFIRLLRMSLISQEFSGTEWQEPGWIFSGVPPGSREEDTSVILNAQGEAVGPGGAKVGHGTSMLSKVSGHRYGVAKRAKTVIVQCRAPVTPQCFQSALGDVFDHIRNPANGVTNPVVSMSVYFDATFIANNGGNQVR